MPPGLCHNIWQSGAVHWYDAVQGNASYAEAERAFRHVVEIDPGCADAWLGLIACAQMSGEREDELPDMVEGLGLSADRFGEDQQEAGMELVAFSKPVGFSRLRISSRERALITAVTGRLQRDDLIGAEQMLRNVTLDSPEMHAASARIDLLRGDFQQALFNAQEARQLPELREDATLLCGIAMQRLGLLDGARALLDDVASFCAVHPEEPLRRRLTALYALAMIDLEAGDDHVGIASLQTIYGLDASYANVATLLGRQSPEQAASRDRAFLELVGQFGELRS